MNDKKIDYFASPKTCEEAVLLRIKGDFRRHMVASGIEQRGIDSVPEDWLEHEATEMLKGFFQALHPRARGGEDLPDLDPCEVEIARLSLLNSVHGEVTSLRARKDPETGFIHYRMVNEYGEQFEIEYPMAKEGLSAAEVLNVFVKADPCPLDTSCDVGFQSYFYSDLDFLADQMGVKGEER